MARRTTDHLIDDIDGGPADHAIAFSHKRHHYEIDLSHKNAAELVAALYPFTSKARAVYPDREPKRQGSVDYPAVREWAQRQGIEVSARGRIAADVIAQYRAR